MTHPIPGADSEREFPPLPTESGLLPLPPDADNTTWHVCGYTVDQMHDYVRADRAAAKVGANVAADLPIDLKWDDKVKGYVSQPFTLSDLAAVAPTDDTITITRAELVTYRNQAFAEGVIEGRDQSIAAGAPAEVPKPVAKVTQGGEFGPGLAFLANGADKPKPGTLLYAAQPAPIAGDVEKDAVLLNFIEKTGYSLICNWKNTGFCGPDGHEWQAFIYGTGSGTTVYGATARQAIDKALAALLANSSSGEAG